MSDTPKDSKPRGSITQVNNLIHAMGGKYHNPLERTHHKWLARQRASKVRMFCWLYDHTCDYQASKYTRDFGPRSPYARDQNGKELHLEHMAADWGVDIRNVLRDWDEGVREGIWRNGTEDQGSKRLYFCGEVAVPADEAAEIGVDSPQSRVCTYPWEKLPPYISKHIQTLPPERIDEFWVGYDVNELVGKKLDALAVAAARDVMEQEHDNWFQEFGASKIRQEHNNGLSPEEQAAREERLAGLRPVLAGYVHTLKQTVQTTPRTPYKAEKTGVQGDVSLLPSELQKEQNSGASEGSETLVSRPGKHSPSHQGQKLNALPAAEEAISTWLKQPQGRFPEVPVEAGIEACKHYPEAAQLYFHELTHVKEWAKDPAFAEFSEDRKTDQIFVGRLILITGAGRDVNRAMAYLLEVVAKFKGLGHGALGKRPRSPNDEGGPRTFGLFLEWARDFAKARARGRAAGA